MTPKEDQQPMTTREELVGNLPLQYFDGPDYCTVKDATGGNFALTVQPELMKLMEDALASRQEVSVGELAGFFVTEFPHLLTMSTQIEVARALIARYSITKRTTEG
jgi:hypothetical protein